MNDDVQSRTNGPDQYIPRLKWYQEKRGTPGVIIVCTYALSTTSGDRTCAPNCEPRALTLTPIVALRVSNRGPVACKIHRPNAAPLLCVAMTKNGMSWSQVRGFGQVRTVQTKTK